SDLAFCLLKRHQLPAISVGILVSCCGNHSACAVPATRNSVAKLARNSFFITSSGKEFEAGEACHDSGRCHAHADCQIILFKASKSAFVAICSRVIAFVPISVGLCAGSELL